MKQKIIWTKKTESFGMQIPIVLMLMVPPTLALSQEWANLEVSVIGATPNRGPVLLSLFDSEKNFLEQPIDTALANTDASGNANFFLSKLPLGDYAVSVFHDEDDNGELNTNFLGIPTELVGFSNNAKGSFGPPSFDQVKFTFDGNKTVSIRLGNAKD